MISIPGLDRLQLNDTGFLLIVGQLKKTFPPPLYKGRKFKNKRGNIGSCDSSVLGRPGAGGGGARSPDLVLAPDDRPNCHCHMCHEAHREHSSEVNFARIKARFVFRIHRQIKSSDLST